MLRVGTVRSGTTNIQRASWHTAHASTSASTVGVTGGLKGLTLLVRDAVDFTAQVLLTCNQSYSDSSCYRNVSTSEVEVEAEASQQVVTAVLTEQTKATNCCPTRAD